ncbi:uncharacterized protein [Coffea arabica]|uniref:Uncharacterized protein n=1 Tax=Coffea arabica TaxID=13443 RepID=A0ABM4VIR6_COFAR
MLPRRGDHYLRQKYSHDGSPREALKQKMLSQEYTFKKQVQELHRLYQIQTILMKNLRLKESASSSFQGISRRPMDAEVSTSHHVKHSDLHFPKKGDGWGTAENPVQVDQYFDGELGASSEEVQLSLSISGDTMQNKSCKKIWDKKLTSISSQYAIDLEESAPTASSRDIQPKSALGCAACSADSGNLHVFQISCSCPNGVNKYLDDGIKRTQSLVDETKNFLEQNNLDQGAKNWLGNVPSMGISCATNICPSREAACIDLNKPLLDEAPHSEEYLVMECSAGASSSVSERVSGEWHKVSSPVGTSRKPESRCISAMTKEDTLNITVMASNSTDSSTIMTGSKSPSVDLESCFKSPSDQSDVHDCLTDNLQHKDAKFVSNLPRKNHKGKTMIEVDDMMGEVDAMSPNLCIRGDNVEDEDRDSSPASFKFGCIGTDPSSSFKTVQSGTRVGKSVSFQNSESSQDESSIHAESKSESFDGKTEGSARDDALIQKGAVSLMYFLLEISSREEDDRVAEVDKMNEIEKGKRDQPQCSSDTFESMVLKLQESNVEDYCVSSMPMEVNDTDKKDYGIRLRRGRRMKDFQKDILPGMASLARHEICEDIRIMEGVIRSREYKKLRSKMANTQNWFTPVRSRRSRLNYIGRKYY